MQHRDPLLLTLQKIAQRLGTSAGVGENDGFIIGFIAQQPQHLLALVFYAIT